MATAGDARGPGPERAFLADLPAEGTSMDGAVELCALESSHLVRSRRAQIGDTIVLFDGQGGSVAARLVDADPRAAKLALIGRYPDREPSVAVTLAVSPPEGGRADDLVAAAAELGVTRFVPLVCDRTPPKRAEQATRRLDRWARLAREAAKVNGRSRLLRLGPPVTLGALLAEPHDGITCVLDPDPDALPFAPGGARAVRLLVGPEGGFTADELERVIRTGASVVRLGATALRTQTAALAGAAIALAAS